MIGSTAEKYDAAACARFVITAAVVGAPRARRLRERRDLSGQDDPDYAGAVLFSQRCAGCHTLTPAGTQGSANRAVRVQGPNLDQRESRS